MRAILRSILALPLASLVLAAKADLTPGVATQLQINQGGYAQVSFQSQSGIIYQLENSTDDMTTWTSYGPAIFGTGENIIRDVPLFGARGFFRLNTNGQAANLPSVDSELDWLTSVITNTTQAGIYSAVKVGSNGTIYIAYFDISRLKLRLAKIINGAITHEDVATAGQDEIYLDLLPDGSPAIAFVAPNNMRSIARFQNGQWNVESLGLDTYNNKVSFFSFAEPLRYFKGEYGGSLYLVTRSGNDWIQQAIPAGGTYKPNGIVLPDGTLAVATQGNTAAATVARQDAQGNWSAEYLPMGPSFTSAPPKLIQLPNGHLAVTVVTQYGQNDHLYALRYFERLDSGWQDEVITSVNDEQRTEYGHINQQNVAVNARGKTVISFAASGRMFYGVRGTRRWTREVVDEPVEFSPHIMGRFNSLAIDPVSGRSILVYCDENTSSIRVSIGNPQQ